MSEGREWGEMCRLPARAGRISSGCCGLSHGVGRSYPRFPRSRGKRLRFGILGQGPGPRRARGDAPLRRNPNPLPHMPQG